MRLAVGTAGRACGGDICVEALCRSSLDDSLANDERDGSNPSLEPRSYVLGDLPPSVSPPLAIVAAANTASQVIHEGPARIAQSQTLRIVSHSCLLGFFAAGYALVLPLDNQVFLGTRYEATGLVIEFRGTASEVPVVDYKCRSRNV